MDLNTANRYRMQTFQTVGLAMFVPFAKFFLDLPDLALEGRIATLIYLFTIGLLSGSMGYIMIIKGYIAAERVRNG